MKKGDKYIVKMVDINGIRKVQVQDLTDKTVVLGDLEDRTVYGSPKPHLRMLITDVEIIEPIRELQ